MAAVEEEKKNVAGLQQQLQMLQQDLEISRKVLGREERKEEDYKRALVDAQVLHKV